MAEILSFNCLPNVLNKTEEYPPDSGLAVASCWLYVLKKLNKNKTKKAGFNDWYFTDIF